MQNGGFYKFEIISGSGADWKKPISDSESAKNSGIGTYVPVLYIFHDQNFVGQCYF